MTRRHRRSNGRYAPLPRDIPTAPSSKIDRFEAMIKTLFVSCSSAVDVRSERHFIPCSQTDGPLKHIYCTIIMDKYQLSSRQRYNCIKLYLQRESVSTGLTREITRNERGSLLFPKATKKVPIVKRYHVPKYVSGSEHVRSIRQWVQYAYDDRVIREEMTVEEEMSIVRDAIRSYDHNRFLFTGYPAPSITSQMCSQQQPQSSSGYNSQHAGPSVNLNPQSSSCGGQQLSTGALQGEGITDEQVGRETGVNDQYEIIPQSDKVLQEAKPRKSAEDTNIYLSLRKVLARELGDAYAISQAAVIEYTTAKPLALRSKFETIVLEFALRTDITSESYRTQFKFLEEICRITVEYRRAAGLDLYEGSESGYWDDTWNCGTRSDF